MARDPREIAEKNARATARGRYFQWLIRRFEAHATDLTRIRDISRQSQSEKRQVLEAIEDMHSGIEQIAKRIGSLQHTLQAGNTAEEMIQKTGDPNGNP